MYSSYNDAKKIKTWEVFINGGRVGTGIDAIQWAKKLKNFQGKFTNING